MWGDITDDTLDHDGEKVDPDFAAEALTDWFQGGAPVFNQHCEFYPPAGQGVSLEMNPGNPVSLRAHVTEPTAIQHVENGVYKDFSVGWYEPEYVPDPTAPNGRMVGGWAREVSLVDAGANKNSHIKGFTVAKSRAKGLPPELFGVSGSAVAYERGDDLELGDGNGDRFATALKSAMTARAEKAMAASRWYAAFKRDIDPDVGGGVDRDKLTASDYVLPSEGDGKFPVVIPDDVEDAAQSWGRYKGPTSFEKFKRKLIALAKRKGSAFVAKLPEAWNVKKGKAMPVDEATKAKGGKGGPVEGHGPAAKEDADEKARKDAPPEEGTKQCPTCKGKGSILDGNRKCPDCEGKGKVPSDFVKSKDSKLAPPFEKKKKEAAPKAADEADEQVDEAIDKLMGSVDDVQDAQAADDDDAKPTDDAVNDAVDAVDDAAHHLEGAQAADVAADEAPKDQSAVDTGQKAESATVTAKSRKNGSNGTTAEQTEASTQDDEQQAEDQSGEGGEQAKKKAKDPFVHDPDNPKCKCKDCKAKRKAGKVKAEKARKAPKAAPYDVVAAHDALCPVYDVPADAALKAIGTDWFQSQYYRAADKGSAKEVAAAYAALSAAHNVSILSLPDFGRIRSAAHKALEATYPDLSAAHYELHSPDQFKRPFLASSNQETPSGGFSLPQPHMAPALEPGQFARMGQIPNQARPSPAPGVSASDLIGKGRSRATKKKFKLPKGARVFYTNASKDDAANAMGMLHDHIAKHFPGICPMGGHDDHDDDGDKGTKGKATTDMAGLPADPGLPKPQSLPEPAGADTGSLKPTSTAGADKGKAKRSAAKADGAERRARRQVKALKRQNRRLKARQVRFMAEVRTELSRPDPRANKQRGPAANFAPLTKEREREDAVATVRAEARRLKTRIHSRNSQVSSDAIEEARSKLPPDIFAAIITSDD